MALAVFRGCNIFFSVVFKHVYFSVYKGKYVSKNFTETDQRRAARINLVTISNKKKMGFCLHRSSVVDSGRSR